MELSVVYHCPSCKRKAPHNLAQLRPGQKRDCQDCGTPVALTRESLVELHHALRDACRH